MKKNKKKLFIYILNFIEILLFSFLIVLIAYNSYPTYLWYHVPILVLSFIGLILGLQSLVIYLRRKKTFLKKPSGLSRLRRAGTIVFFSAFTLMLLQPIILYSTIFFTQKIKIEGVVIQKKISEHEISAGKGHSWISFWEIGVVNGYGKIEKFNLYNYKKEWQSINLYDSVEIECYPFIHDAFLSVKKRNPVNH